MVLELDSVQLAVATAVVAGKPVVLEERVLELVLAISAVADEVAVVAGVAGVGPVAALEP